LLEGALAKICHQIWVTRCSRQRQLDRLRICRGMDTETAVARIKAQPSQEEKVAQSDVVIDTNGLMTDTEKQFQMAWERLPNPALAGTKLLPPLPPRPVVPPSRETSPPAATVDSPPPISPPEKPAVAPTPLPDAPKPTRPDDLEVRRARPSDIASMLLLIQKATGGAVKMKRAELLMALSERGYFIGQIGAEVSAVVGWHIASQAARIDQIFIHPLEAAATTGLAILEETEKSANAHVCEIIMAFVPNDAPNELRQMFAWREFAPANKADLPAVWQKAIAESQPENTQLLLKVLRDRRLKKG
ncbi:MAG: dephospho-CoA kinase, partial [Chloroflexi bacterium]|nr:dephospho-CoA kinase [Chloroflexota bacterium]